MRNSKSAGRRGWAVGLAIISVVGGDSQLAQAGFDLGDAANYAVLYEGAGSHNLQINSSPVNGSTISGNIGLGDELGGMPQFQPSNPAVINGNINFAGAVNVNNSGAVINGSINGGVNMVESDLDSLNSLSSTLGAATGTSVAINIANGGSQTINAEGGTQVSSGSYKGTYVYTVTSLNFVNGAKLTINGSASDYVVLNFNYNAHFAGTITLTGGIKSDQVLFNIIGGANLTGGDNLQYAANDVSQTGTFLDPNGTITMNSVNLTGRLFGGDSSDMQIVSGGTIVAPAGVPVPESGTMLAGALLLLPFGASTLRVLRKKSVA